MFKTLFGDITDGRLRRLQFLGYSLFLVLLMIGFGLAVVMAIGAGEQLIGGDLQQAQDKLREWFTLPFLIVLGLVLFVLLFAHLNITAKRIRDIGLPGWWTVLGIAVLTGVVSHRGFESGRQRPLQPDLARVGADSRQCLCQGTVVESMY